MAINNHGFIDLIQHRQPCQNKDVEALLVIWIGEYGADSLYWKNNNKNNWDSELDCRKYHLKII